MLTLRRRDGEVFNVSVRPRGPIDEAFDDSATDDRPDRSWRGWLINSSPFIATNNLLLKGIDYRQSDFHSQHFFVQTSRSS